MQCNCPPDAHLFLKAMTKNLATEYLRVAMGSAANFSGLGTYVAYYIVCQTPNLDPNALENAFSSSDSE